MVTFTCPLSSITNPANGTYRIITTDDGTFFQLWNTTTSDWHTIYLIGSAGSQSLAIGPGQS